MKTSSMLILFLVSFILMNASFSAEDEKPQLQPINYMVEMRDGTKLSTDVYIPEKGGPLYPVLLERTPYNKVNLKGLVHFAENGDFATVAQDVRGRYESEGHPRPFEDDGWGEHQDGFDTVQWILSQPWCNGRIATTGGSAGGITQIQLAGSAPPGIVGQHVVVAPLSGYHSTFYWNGVFRKSLVEGWLVAAQWPADNLGEIRSHPTYDSYWQVQNLGERVDKVNWPVVISAGWYDIFQQGSIDAFQAIQEKGGPNARKNVHLVMGPFHHGINMLKVGEFEFPESAKIPDTWPKGSDWFRHWLNDEPLSVDPPPVLYYTMGEMPVGDAPGNEWHEAQSWPPPSKPVQFYLTETEGLAKQKPSDGKLAYTYDPENPVPTAGGTNLLIPAGPFDQRNYLINKKEDLRANIEDRDDVLIFATEPLKEPIEVTGNVRAVLYISTSAVDTDFTVKLTDVYPDGRSMLITDGITRLGFRNSLETFETATPGEVYRLDVDVWSTSIVFNKGHRIQIAVSSSNAPKYEPNPNTGNLDWKSTEKIKAQQTIYIGGERASHVILPIIE